MTIVVAGSATAFSFLNLNQAINSQATIYIDENGQEQKTFDEDLSDINSKEIIQIGYYQESLTKKIRAPIMPTKILKVPETLPSVITSLKNVFRYCDKFNQDISKWDVSNVKDMTSMFNWATNFNQDLSKWNVNSETFFYLFSSEAGFANDVSKQPHFTRSQPTIYLDENNQQQETDKKDLSNIKTKKIVQIGFYEIDPDEIVAVKMPNEILEVPNSLPRQIALLDSMFRNCILFNQDLSNWDTSNIISTNSMFSGAQSFNGDISTWDISNLLVTFYMFVNAKNFNGDLSKWNTKNVTDMHSMFQDAASFNQDISHWDTSRVFDMSLMFKNATNFNQDLSKWDVKKVKNYEQFAEGSGIAENQKKWPNFKNSNFS